MDSSSSAVLAAAQADYSSVATLIQELVAIPSRGGIDPYQPVLDHVEQWLTNRQLAHRVLLDEADGSPVGIVCEIIGDQPGPRWVLDACLDTAGYGNVDAWTHHPATPVITGDWMWGRGSADSKAGAAIFAHIAARLAQATDTMHGSLVLLLDVDEHTGRFGGARRYFEGADAPADVAGVMIGYPGIDHVIVGGRGIHRSRLHVSGVSSHSGGRHRTPNAIEKAARLVQAVSSAPLPESTTVTFPEPRITVTGIEGGRDYSATPDECIVDVDIRTTPVFDCHAAESTLKTVVQDVDESWPNAT
jgi:succinyl-diaminopimelate desuccinylase